MRVARRLVRTLIFVLGSIVLTLGVAVAATIGLSALGVGRQPLPLNEPRTSTDFPTVGPASLFFDDYYDVRESRRNAFVGVAISGGGSRAAVFAAEVLSALAELGFLDHVTAVSSVSGGSLPAAYYALSTRDPQRWPMSRIRDVMATDFHDDLVRSLLTPSTLLRTLGSPYNRTDLLADILDRRLFQGATFGLLAHPQAGARRTQPHLFLNSTVAGSNASFVFDDTTFAALGSELANYRIARAVAASAAFPGLLNQTSVRDYTQDFPFAAADVRDPRGLTRQWLEGQDAFSTYLRVSLRTARVWPLVRPDIDDRQALADGLNWLIDDLAMWDEQFFAPAHLDIAGLSASERAQVALGRRLISPGLARGWARQILTRAYRSYLAELPPMYVHVYDGGPSDNLGWETIKTAAAAYVDHAPKSAPAGGCFVFVIDAHPQRVSESDAFTLDTRQGFTYLVDYASIADATSTLLDQQRDRALGDMQGATSGGNPLEAWPIFARSDPRQATVGDCVVWRFGFDRLMSVLLRTRPRGVAADPWERENARAFDAHRTLGAVLNATATDFHLTGPRNCSQTRLRQALGAAASILIDEDPAAVAFARGWFEQHFDSMPQRRPPPPLYDDVGWARVLTRSDGFSVQSVECTK